MVLYFQTIFYLYTNKSVKSASIRIEDGNKTTIKMKKMKCPKGEIGYLWEARISFKTNSTAGNIEYKYMLERNHKSSTSIDTIRRAETGSTNYDSFHEKAGDFSNFSERATICYSKWLFETVDEQNFEARVTAITNMNFNFHQLDSKVLKTFLSWIFQQETKDQIPNSLYLGVLLALVNENNAFDWEKKFEETLYKRFVDNLLDVLSSEKATILWNHDKKPPVNSFTLLATKLVNASSFPKWLSFATSFNSCLGVEQILSVYNPTLTQGLEYSQEKYANLVDCMTQYMSNDHMRGLPEMLLPMAERILFDAPDIAAVVSLHGKNEFLNLFHKTEDITKVFRNVLIKKAKDTLRNNKGCLSNTLIEISKIPQTLQTEAFSQIILEFIELPFHHCPEQEIITFCDEMSRDDHFSIEEIISVLHVLVMSNQPRCHKLFIRLLTSKFYDIWWEKLGKNQHLSILSKWMTTDLAEKPEQPSKCQPGDVFKRAEELESLNIFSAGSIHDACVRGFERKKKHSNNFTPASMLEALVVVERLSTDLKECYKKIFGSMLKESQSVKEDVVSCCKNKCWFTNTSPNSGQKISRYAFVSTMLWCKHMLSQYCLVRS